MIRIERLDGTQAAEAEDAIRLVYAEAFAEPPYEKTKADVDANFRRFRPQTKKPSFRAALARTDDGVPVGVAYGYALPADSGWWDIVEPPVGQEMRHEDGHRTFGLMELAVRAAWRRQGVAKQLHAALLADMPEERVILNARPDAEPAQAAYQSWGYRAVGQGHPWAGADIHRIMLLTKSDYFTSAT